MFLFLSRGTFVSVSRQKRPLPAGPVERNETPLIDPRDPTPAYHQMRRTLEEWIAVGRYDIGARLPSESELCTVFGVSRNTVRKVLAQIAKAGWIAREQGRGSFVRKVPGALTGWRSDSKGALFCRFASSRVVLRIGCARDPMADGQPASCFHGGKFRQRRQFLLRRAGGGERPMKNVKVYRSWLTRKPRASSQKAARMD